MNCAAFLLIAMAATAAAARAEERTWNKVVYLGGVPGVRVDRLDFEQTLVLTPCKLMVRVKPPPTQDSSPEPKKAPRLLFEVHLGSVLAVAYEGFRHDMHGAQRWVGIQGHWPKATDHLIILEYRLGNGREAEVLLRVRKADHQEIMGLLKKAVLDCRPAEKS